MSNLITTDFAIQNRTLASLNNVNGQYLRTIIASASEVIQRVCMRKFGVNTYTEYLSGGGYPNQYLDLEQYPVVSPGITRVATRPMPVLFITNGLPAVNQRATVATTDTGVTLYTMASGVPTTTTLTYADNPTLSAIATAVAGLGNGWSARTDSTFALYPSVDLKPLQGAMSATATGGGAALEMHTEDVYAWGASNESYSDLPRYGWRLDPESSQLWGHFPEGRLNIRVDYTAGDDTIPSDIQQGCVRLCALMVEDDRRDSAVTSQQLGPYDVTLRTKAQTLVMNPAVWEFIHHHRDYSKLVVET